LFGGDRCPEQRNGSNYGPLNANDSVREETMAGEATSVISGGSTGIGLAVAIRLAQDGGRIAILGRRSAELDAALNEIGNAGAADALAIATDATDDVQVENAFTIIGGRWGEVNALVNAVGPTGAGRFDDLSDEAWHDAFDQGVLTAVRCIRHVLPLMRKASWGRIVNITALSVKHQSSGLIGYTAAKAALASVTKNLAGSLAAEEILVNAVAPGAVLTSAIQAAVGSAGGDVNDPRDAYRVMSAQYGLSADLRRVADAAEVAEVVAFCASQANTYMTGAQLNVDGGSDFC
jgi:NAD(P)-dependent dehydrogenase (short-subunit alcohol dehydrogenase family)